MESFIRRVRQCVLDHQLAGRGERILVAVSGGLDSVVLLHVLHELAPEFKWQLAVAHFEHGLRGRAGKADARFVRALAARLKLRCFIGEGDVPAAAKRAAESVEMAGRRLRHEFLARAAKRFRADSIALAHHADDQVELFFLRLFRGAGGEGLGGMRWSNPSPADHRFRLIRPLLNLRRAELASYCSRAGLRFREDASNADARILRNRIRRELVPLIERRFAPVLKEVVVRTMDVLRADSDLVLAEATKFLAGKRTRSFGNLHRAAQRMIVSLQLRSLRLEPEFRLIETLRRSPETPVTVSPKTTVTLWRDGTIDVNRQRRLNYTRAARDVSLSPLPHRCVFGGCEISWRLRRRPEPFPNPPAIEQFDAAKVGGRIALRFWRPGDRFRPLGFPKETKLQDLFVNRKVPVGARRRRILATTAAGGIFWVEGLPPGEAFKITRATRRVLIWSYQREPDPATASPRRSSGQVAAGRVSTKP